MLATIFKAIIPYMKPITAQILNVEIFIESWLIEDPGIARYLGIKEVSYQPCICPPHGN